MDKSCRHFFLYAKHHYQRTDVLADLKKIMGDRCALEPEYIRVGDINNLLLRQVYPLLEKRGNPEDAFIVFILRVQETSIMEACLSFMAITEVRHIDFELGDADSCVLPLSESIKIRLKP